MNWTKGKRQIFIQIFSLYLINAISYSQEKIIRVWEGKIPGAIDNPSYRTETVYIDGNKPRLSKVSDPTLDFYPAQASLSNGTAIVICPGGGYGRLAIDHEGSDVAAWLNQMGITAFVLKYRLPSDAIMVNKSVGPLQDGQEAIRIVRRHSKEWSIDPHKIGIMGFSAGGHLASTVSTHFREEVYKPADTTSARPDFSILVYPVVSMDSTITHRGSRDNLLGDQPSKELVHYFSNAQWVDSGTTPAFIVHASDDHTVHVQNSIEYFLALEKYGVSSEIHVYQTGGHGFGLAAGRGTESAWPEACRRWLHALKFL